MVNKQRNNKKQIKDNQDKFTSTNNEIQQAIEILRNAVHCKLGLQNFTNDLIKQYTKQKIVDFFYMYRNKIWCIYFRSNIYLYTNKIFLKFNKSLNMNQ